MAKKDQVVNEVEKDDEDCFGKFFDGEDGDCKKCLEGKKCKAEMTATKKSAAVDEDADEDEEEASVTKKSTKKEKAKKVAPPVEEDEEDEEDEPEVAPVKAKKASKKAAKPPVDEDEDEEDNDEADAEVDELETLTAVIAKKARKIAEAILGGKNLVEWKGDKLEFKVFDVTIAQKLVKKSKKKDRTPEQIEFKVFCRGELKDNDDMIAYVKALGCTWEEHATPLINRMRAVECLKAYMVEKELVTSDLKSLAEVTAPPKKSKKK